MTGFVPFEAPVGPVNPDGPAQPDRGPALALVAAEGWPATTTVRLGGWLLQSADGFTGRANSVVPAGSPGTALDEALARVHAFYAGLGRSPLLRVTVGTPLEGRLRDRGYRVVSSGKETYDTTDVLVSPLAVLRQRLEQIGVPDAGVEFGGLDADWLAMYGRPTSSPAARHVLGGPERLALARIRATPHHAGTGAAGLLAIGRGVVTGRWLGIAAVEVAPGSRRRGLARAIMAGIAEWADDEGADWVYLQVGSENVPAHHLYARLGFRPDHSYRYYQPQAAAVDDAVHR